MIPVAFVLPFYLQPGSTRVARNDASTVWFRVVAASVASLAVVACVHWSPARCGLSLTEWLGIKASVYDIALAARLLVFLFSGPIAQLLGGGMEVPYMSCPVHMVVRNLLCAPLTEELVFRACVCRVLLSANTAPHWVILFSPIFFGVAHIHHIIEAVCLRKHGLRSAILSQSFQMLYTTLFGNLACLLYFSTGSLATAVVLHAGCNFFGVPRFDRAAFRREFAVLVVTIWVVGNTFAIIVTVWMACNPFVLAKCHMGHDRLQ